MNTKFKRFVICYNLIFIIVMLWLYAPFKATLPPKPNTKTTQPLVIDCIPAYGGDCYLFMQGDDVMVLDTGYANAYEEIKATLNAYGITTIDTLLITHLHPDHIGGVGRLTADFAVKQMLIQPLTVSNRAAGRLFTNNATTAIDNLKIGDTFVIGEATGVVLSPHTRTNGLSNQKNIVFKLYYGSTTLLFMGDAYSVTEARLLKEGIDVSAGVLKVGHHGLGSSTANAFLDAVNPDIVLLPPKFSRVAKVAVQTLKRGIPTFGSYSAMHYVLTIDAHSITATDYPAHMQH